MTAARHQSTVLFRVGAGALAFSAGIGLVGEPATAESRGLTVRVQSMVDGDGQSPRDVQLYTASYALVIGIDKYTGGWPALSNAVKDAEEVALALDAQGFEVQLRTDLDSSNLERVIKSFFVRKGASPGARLLLWYAGHGHTIGGEGFLVPADAPIGADPEFKLMALHMRDFGSWVRLAESKHVLAIFDSCFAGTIFASARSSPPTAITRATQYPVRQFLTSGDAEQQVSDDGTFRGLFVEALLGRETADLNRDGYLTASELGMFLSDRVTNLTRGRQTPRYGKLRDKDFDRGDFVLSSRHADPGPRLSVTSAETDQILHQSVFWESIRDSEEPRDFEAYLDRYPKGAFASIARIKLDRFSAPSQPALIPRDERRWATTAANVRAEPDATAARLGVLAQGAVVHITGEVRADRELWYRIRQPTGQPGFVLGRLLALTQPPKQPETPPLEGSNGQGTPNSYAVQIEAVRRARRETRADQIADLLQQRTVRTLQREKCQQSCASTPFRSQVERQRKWPAARDRCNSALPNYSAYDQCVDRQRDRFEQRLLGECKQRC